MFLTLTLNAFWILTSPNKLHFISYFGPVSNSRPKWIHAQRFGQNTMQLESIQITRWPKVWNKMILITDTCEAVLVIYLFLALCHDVRVFRGPDSDAVPVILFYQGGDLHNTALLLELEMTDIWLLHGLPVQHNAKYLLYQQIIVLFNLNVNRHLGEFLEDVLQQRDSPVLSHAVLPWCRFSGVRIFI